MIYSVICSLSLFQHTQVSFTVFTNVSLFFCLRRKSKDDTWVSDNTYWELRKDPDFAHIDFPTLWWPLNCRSHAFRPAQLLYCDPGWFWWCPYPSLTIHIQYCSSLLQFIQVIALIASAYLCCVNMFMQTYYENVDTFRQILPMFSPDMLHSIT